MTQKRVVIIGGGITGLTTAFRLKQFAKEQHANIECIVIEKDSRLGGKIRTERENGFVMENGPDSILARKQAGVDLMRSLGIESELVGSNTTALKTYVLHHGRLEPLPPGTNMGIPMQIMPFATTRLLSVWGKARALLDLVIPRSKQSGDQSLGHFLRRRVGNEVINNMAEPLLAGIYAGSVDDLSLQATFPMFESLEKKYRSLIIGSAKQRKGMPKPTVGSGRSAFVTLKSGLQTLVERLYDELQDWAALTTDTTVTEIKRGDSGDYLVTALSKAGTEQTYTADAVVVATPAFAASDLLSSVTEHADLLKQIRYVSTATVLLAFDKGTLGSDFDASGFVVPRSENRFITACTWISSKWTHSTPEGKVLVRCYVGRTGQEQDLERGDTEMIETVRGELKAILGIDSKPWFAKVTRWDAAMPQYRVNHLQHVADIELRLKQDAPGVFIAGAGYHGLGIPDCIADANQTVEKLLSHLELK